MACSWRWSRRSGGGGVGDEDRTLEFAMLWMAHTWAHQRVHQCREIRWPARTFTDILSPTEHKPGDFCGPPDDTRLVGGSSPSGRAGVGGEAVAGQEPPTSKNRCGRGNCSERPAGAASERETASADPLVRFSCLLSPLGSACASGRGTARRGQPANTGSPVRWGSPGP